MGVKQRMIRAKSLHANVDVVWKVKVFLGEGDIGEVDPWTVGSSVITCK